METAGLTTSIAVEWNDFEANWIADRIPFLRWVLDRAVGGSRLGTVLVPDALHSGRLVEMLSPVASWTVCVEETHAASRLIQQRLVGAAVENIFVTAGQLPSLLFADETFDQSIWIVPAATCPTLADRLAGLARVLKRNGRAVLLLIPDPYIDPPTDFEMRGEPARVEGLIEGLAASARTAFGAVECVRLAATSVAPSQDAFLSAYFHAKQPPSAERDAVDRTLDTLKKRYDGAMGGTAPATVRTNIAIVTADRR